MTHITKLSIASTITALASTICLHADNQPAQIQDHGATTQLADTIVVANTYEVPLSEVGSTVNVISREDLEIGQTTFVLDALRELPGLYLANNGGPGTSSRITTRGLTQEPIILIDGIEVSNPSRNLGASLNPGRLFSNSVESIEFLKGPQSSLYGADALAGVVNITTREASDGESNGSLTAGAGSNSTRQFNADYQASQGAWDLSITANRLISDGFSSRDSDNEDDGYENTSVSSKVGYQATENLKFYAVAYYIDAESDYDRRRSDSYAESQNEELFTKGGAILQATDQWQTEASFAFTNILYETKDITGVSEFEGDRYKADWRNAITLNETWMIATGAEYEKEDNRSSFGDRDEYSYYLDNSLEVIENLFWTLGGRYDDNSDYGSNATWRTTLSYLIEPLGARLHGSLGTSFRAPSLYQTYHPIYGNQNLKAEEGKGWDYGVEFSLLEGAIILDATVFHNEIDNKIDFVDPDGFFGPITGSYINNSQYESDGLELSAKWQALENLLLRANYTYTDAQNEDGSDPDHVPENMANFSAIWSTFDSKLDLKASLRFIDERVTSAGVAEDFTTIDLAGQYALTDRFTLWSAINNLLDEDYQEIVGYNTTGLNIMAGVRIKF